MSDESKPQSAPKQDEQRCPQCATCPGCKGRGVVDEKRAREIKSGEVDS